MSKNALNQPRSRGERAVPPVAATTPVALHVGYHKCASTSLQKNLFDNHPQIRPMRKHAGFADADRAVEMVADQCNVRMNVPGENVPEDAVSLWRLAEREARDAGQLPLFSWERLTREVFFRTSTDERLPKALKALVGDARIVVIVRHQIRLLESLYLSRIKPPSYLLPEQWFDVEGRRNSASYFYADVIATYQSVFGAENVLVLPFEELALDPESFAARICEHIGVDPGLARGLLAWPARNSRPSARVQKYSLLRYKLLPGVSFGQLLPEAWRDEVYRLLSKDQKKSAAVFARELVDTLEDTYRVQNRRLAESQGLDLERYGYPL